MKKFATISMLVSLLAMSTAAFADDASAARKDAPLPSTTTTAQADATSTTTVTSGDSSDTATPMPTTPAARPATKETLTLYNSMRPNRPVLFTGAILFAGTYATTATLTAVSDNANADKNLYLPIVGPWVHLASGSATATNRTADTLLVAGSGVIQGVGAGLMVMSLFIPESVPAATIQAGNTKVHITPASFGVGSAGVGAGGTF